MHGSLHYPGLFTAHYLNEKISDKDRTPYKSKNHRYSDGQFYHFGAFMSILLFENDYRKMKLDC